jgi:serine phosphatase RsbU (regulator of sigma subunit)
MTNQKILIVDDEPFNVDYLEQELEESDYETISAVNGQDALDKVQSESPDLILLDIMMPLMDGFEALSHLKANPATRDIPVIVISANNDLRSVVKGIQLGAEDYLPKPFEPVLLHARISSCLEKKRLRDLQQLYLKGLERELDIGREIQKGFLPDMLPLAEGWEIAASLMSAREVAGDFYDAFELPDGNIALVIADVCDKGVGAALFMTLFRSLIRITANQEYFEHTERVAAPPSAVECLKRAMTLTNNYISETHGNSGMFATIFFSILDPRTGKLTYINGGHEPPLIIRSGMVRESLHKTGPAVGAIPNWCFEVLETNLLAGEVLFAYTDGVPDAKDLQGAFFGRERLLVILQRTDGSAQELIKAIETELHQYIGSAIQFDDITLLAVKRVKL